MSLKMHFLVLLCVLSVAFAVQNETFDLNGAQDQLIFAQIIYRHGARNIIRPIPNDSSSDESNWPGGYGALTNKGKQQQFDLGKFFRARYFGNLLGNGEYSPEEINVISSDHPRTMMSAAVNLAGLFPPNENQQWSKELLWQPIPIHVPIQWKNDYYLVTVVAPCERFDYLIKPFIDKHLENNKGLIKRLKKILKKSISLIDAHYIYDGLSIKLYNNMTLPEWAKELFYPGCDLEKFAYKNIKILTQTKELTRLKSGFLLREIMDRFVAKANSNLKPDYKLFFYSAHDITIACLLNIFDLFEAIPPFASALMLELNQSKDGFYIQMFYKNSTTENHLLDIPNCGTKCPLEKLYELSEPYFPETDFKTGCLLRDSEKNHESAGSTMLCPMLSMSIIFITVNLVQLIYK